jgi:hypothetical protein
MILAKERIPRTQTKNPVGRHTNNSHRDPFAAALAKAQEILHHTKRSKE